MRSLILDSGWSAAGPVRCCWRLSWLRLAVCVFGAFSPPGSKRTAIWLVALRGLTIPVKRRRGGNWGEREKKGQGDG
jgi:hypothetical protein